MSQKSLQFIIYVLKYSPYFSLTNFLLFFLIIKNFIIIVNYLNWDLNLRSLFLDKNFLLLLKILYLAQLITMTCYDDIVAFLFIYYYWWTHDTDAALYYTLLE